MDAIASAARRLDSGPNTIQVLVSLPFGEGSEMRWDLINNGGLLVTLLIELGFTKTQFNVLCLLLYARHPEL